MFFLVVHGWPTAPLCIVLALGYLLRRAATMWRSRWHLIYSVEAAACAVAGDVMILAFLRLKLHGNAHWLQYPWGLMGAVLVGVWSLGAVWHPERRGRTEATYDATGRLDRLSDWFGEATIAAGLGSLIVVVVMAGRFVPGDPLSADLVPVHLAILAAGTLPLALMIVRRGIAWVWRHRR